MIKKYHAKGQFAYLWFIAVEPSKQKKGIGSVLIKEVIDEYKQQQRAIYLETSVDRNLSFYKNLALKFLTHWI